MLVDRCRSAEETLVGRTTSEDGTSTEVLMKSRVDPGSGGLCWLPVDAAVAAAGMWKSLWQSCVRSQLRARIGLLDMYCRSRLGMCDCCCKPAHDIFPQVSNLKPPHTNNFYHKIGVEQASSTQCESKFWPRGRWRRGGSPSLQVKKALSWQLITRHDVTRSKTIYSPR